MLHLKPKLPSFLFRAKSCSFILYRMVSVVPTMIGMVRLSSTLSGSDSASVPTVPAITASSGEICVAAALIERVRHAVLPSIVLRLLYGILWVPKFFPTSVDPASPRHVISMHVKAILSSKRRSGIIMPMT